MAGLAGRSRLYVVRDVQVDPIRGTDEFDRVGSPNRRAIALELDLRLERLARSTLTCEQTGIGLIEAKDLPALFHLTQIVPDPRPGVPPSGG
jgi:hypothetical protein